MTLTSGQRRRRILALAVPIIGGMVSQNLLNLIDTAMVGQLGSAALGAVGFGGMVNWLVGAFFLAMGSGVQAITARRTGEGAPQGAIAALHGALAIALVVVVPYGVLVGSQSEHIFALLSDDPEVIRQGAPYLRIRLFVVCFAVANFCFRGYWNGVGRSMIYLRTIVTIHIVNVFLNWVLIYGNLGFDPLGVKGAALASAIAVAVGTGTYVVLGLRLTRRLGFLSAGAMPAGTIPSVLRLSIPAGLQNLFMSAGFTAFYAIAQQLGTPQLAATSVLINLALVCILPSIGFGLAAATLVGQALGAGQKAEAVQWGWHTMRIAMVAMVIMGGALALAPSTWLRLLMEDPHAEALAVLPLVLLGLTQPIDGAGNVLAQALIGAGAVRVVTIVSIVLQWGLFLPGAYLATMVFDGGLISLWIAMGIWRTVFTVIVAVIFAKGRWADVEV